MRRAGPVLAVLLAGGVPAGAQIVRQSEPPLPELAGASALRLEGTPVQGGLVRGHVRPGTRLTLDDRDVAVAADGSFVIGFDRDAPATMRVAEHFKGPTGTPLGAVTTLTVAPRAWRIERLNTLPRFPAPDPVMAQLRPPELAQIAAARAIETDAQGGGSASSGRRSAAFRAGSGRSASIVVSRAPIIRAPTWRCRWARPSSRRRTAS